MGPEGPVSTIPLANVAAWFGIKGNPSLLLPWPGAASAVPPPAAGPRAP